MYPQQSTLPCTLPCMLKHAHSNTHPPMHPQVATRRVKGNLKNDIPFVDEPLVKLDGIGRQTAEKLADIVSAARKAGVRIDLPQFLLESGMCLCCSCCRSSCCGFVLVVIVVLCFGLCTGALGVVSVVGIPACTPLYCIPRQMCFTHVTPLICKHLFSTIMLTHTPCPTSCRASRGGHCGRAEGAHERS